MKSPFNTLLCVFVLAGGIALSVSMYKLYVTVFATKVPYANSERLVTIARLTPSGNHHTDWPFQTLRAFRESQGVFEKIMPYVPDSLSLRGDRGDLSVQGVYVDADCFATIGWHAVMGRDFMPEDSWPDSARVAVISHTLWKNLFGGSADVIGKTIVTDGTSRTIVGVMPEGFDGPFPCGNTEVWLPLNLDTVTAETGWAYDADLLCVVREGLGREEVLRRTMSDAMKAVRAYPAENDNVSSVSVRYLNDVHAKASEQRVLYAVFLCSFLVLLMSCGIVSGLLTARYSSRAQEIAVRTALGASRLQIVVQMMMEFIMIASVSAVLGFLLSRWFDVTVLGVFYERVHLPPFMREYDVGHMVLFVLFLICLVSVVSTIVPAVRASRADLNSVFRESTRTGSSRNMVRLSGFLISWQVATAFVVLFGSLMIAIFLHAGANRNKTFDPAEYMVFRIAFNAQDHADYEARCREVDALVEAVGGIPGVEKACITNELFSGNHMSAKWTYVWIDGVNYADDGDVPLSFKRVVSPGYFDAMNIPILAGRDFNSSDRYDRPVVVVSEGFARQHFGTTDVLGRRIKLRREGPFLGIVGVVPEVFNPNGDPSAQYGFFRPYASEPGNDVDLFVKTPLAFEEARQAVTNLIKSVDDRVCVVNTWTYNDAINRNGRTSFLGFLLALFSSFSACALCMTAGGLFGIVSFFSAARREEIGIRLALGANPNGLVILMTKTGFAFVLAGLAMGCAGGFLLQRILARQFYVGGSFLWVYGSAAALILLIVGVSFFVPACRMAWHEPSRFLHE